MSVWWLIFGMAVVTYLPRLFPLFVVKDIPMPGWVKRWLQYVPYAALGALIFPGIMTVDQSNPLIGVMVGILVAMAAWFTRNLVLLVVLGIVLMIIFQS